MQKIFESNRRGSDLAHMDGAMGYVREIDSEVALKLLGNKMTFPPTAKLYCLYGADGTPISVSGSREAAIGDAREHDLIPASLH